MQKKTPQDYAKELLQMYRANTTAMQSTTPPEKLYPLPPETVTSTILPHNIEGVFEDGTGGMQVNVTTLRRLYPVEGAIVTVFTGNPGSQSVVETDVTDQSGKTGVFNLKTPPKTDSQQSENGGEAPYANYNISVKSDGYVEQIAMNVPVFSGVVSVQGFDLLPITAAGGHTEPQIINEGNTYDL